MRARWPEFALRMDRPVRIASAVLLLVVVLGAIHSERESLAGYFVAVGIVMGLFCVISLALGYAVPRRLGLTEPEAIASSFEIGLHNSTLAITMAVTVLGSTQMAVPGAVYGILMFFIAAAFGVFFTRRGGVPRPQAAAE